MIMISSISLALRTKCGTRDFARKRIAPSMGHATSPAQTESTAKRPLTTAANKNEIVASVDKTDDAPTIPKLDLRLIVRPATYSIITVNSSKECDASIKEAAVDATGTSPPPLTHSGDKGVTPIVNTKHRR